MKKHILAILTLPFVISAFTAINISNAQSFNSPNPLLQQNPPHVPQNQQVKQPVQQQKTQWQQQLKQSGIISSPAKVRK